MRARALFVVSGVLAGVSAAASPSAFAQSWSVQGGVIARGEYNDNYFFTESNRQSAFTGSLTPFVAASRSTETSDVTAVVAVGANKVWSISPSTDYLSGRASIEGSWRDARSAWTAGASFIRAPSLETTFSNDAVLGLAYTNALTAAVDYEYELTENWALGANGGAYHNRYDSVIGSEAFSENRGYSVAGTAAYAHSERTRFDFALAYLHDDSATSRSDSATATIGVVHELSPQLIVSLSAGGFWIDTTVDAQAFPSAASGRANGGLYGGHVAYDFSELGRITVAVGETLSPSGNGVLNKNDNAVLALTYRLTERATGRLGASFTRTTFPQATTASNDYDLYQAEVGFTYRLAERWTLEAGYRFATAHYSGNVGEPRSNVAFASIAYNWPGTSFTSWASSVSENRIEPGARPLILRESPTEGAPFDRFPIP
jgi:hypothetical protein